VSQGSEESHPGMQAPSRLPEDVGQGCWNRVGVWGDELPRCPLLAELIHCKNCPHYVSAGRELFRRAAPPGEMLQVEPRAGLGATHAGKSALVFRLGDELLGLDMEVLAEVTQLRSAYVHRLPRRESAVLRGVYNLHGRLVPLLSLGGLLGVLPSLETTSSGYLVVVALQRELRLAFPVTQLLGIQSWAEEQLVDPAAHAGSYLVYVRGLLPYGERRLGLLRADRVVEGFKKALSS
jgi:chemotaxis-related protein WspD